MNRQAIIVVGWSMVIIGMVAVCLAIGGCQPMQGSPALDEASEAIGAASTASAKVDAYAASADAAVKQALPFTIPPGSTILDTARANVAAARRENAKAADEHSKAATAVANAEHDSQAKDKRYAALEEKWYVTWGRRAEWAFWIVVGGWMTLSAFALVSGLFNPLSVVGKAGGLALAALRSVRFVGSWFSEPVAAGRDAIAHAIAKRSKPHDEDVS